MLGLNGKISWKSLAVTIAMIVGLGVSGLKAWGDAKDERRTNRENIAIMQKQFEHINNSMNKMEKKQMTEKQLMDAFRRVIQEEKKNKEP